MNDDFKGYYKQTRENRIKILKDNGYISNESFEYLISEKTLDNDVADKIIENQIGVFGVPFGIAPNFLINKKDYVIPMSTEEPSVIAAASNAAKIIRENGGFTVKIKSREMVGHIAFYDIIDVENAIEIIKDNEENILNIANKKEEELVKLGGGATRIKVLKKDKFLVVYLYVNTLDAMGANMINTMLEAISDEILKLINGIKLMSIISNYSVDTMVEASCRLKVSKDFGTRMNLAYEFAKSDIYRAVTNNKGVLNGITALCLVSGNDTRAIEASIHSYACRDGKYMPLTKWEYIDGYLYGTLLIPLPIATIGGTINKNRHSKIALEILKVKKAKDLAIIMAALGLAQNFSALRALVTEGIQKGHMRLHKRSSEIKE